MNKTLAIDFDGVIHDYKHPIDGKKLGAPLDGSVVALDELYDAGYKIIIHTVKARNEQGKQMVEDWLDHYSIEHHEVTAIKPNANYYIDDHAVKHISWDDTFNQIGFNTDDENDW